jgi:hypothetical protein
MHDAKMSGAREFGVWGSGAPRREFLHADDLASAVVTVMERSSAEEPVNVGTGTDLTIAELAYAVRGRRRPRRRVAIRYQQTRWNTAQIARTSHACVLWVGPEDQPCGGFGGFVSLGTASTTSRRPPSCSCGNTEEKFPCHSRYLVSEAAPGSEVDTCMGSLPVKLTHI